jgi:16S rRNA processing protein RimM
VSATGGGGDWVEPEHLVVGHIAKAHGTRGELFVWPLTDRPDDVFAPGRELLLGDEGGALEVGVPTVTVEAVRPFKRGLLVKLAAVASREDADLLLRRYLLLPRSDLPPLEEDEVLYHELLGMHVVTVDGDVVGTVREVFETEPHHLLEVAADGGRTHLIPFAARIVRQVDRQQKRLVIDPPAGLLDL